jgi:peroxiredoxin
MFVSKKRGMITISGFITIFTIFVCATAYSESGAFKGSIYNPGKLKSIDSSLKVNVGDKAPGFTLPAIDGKNISLNQFRGKKNVVLSFVPAAWTPICSDQWPGYNIAKEIFDEYDAVLLGITTDNIPTLFAWTNAMGRVWFPVLSDFWPHGRVADSYGVLRSDGISDRAILIIDKKGIITFIEVNDINVRPRLEVIVDELKKLKD